ncbi:MAG TPA: RND transporter [Comamonadaceae bacterium]|uniref:efflux RND transporter permease subunit n=1 Tax=Acidovorax sp. 210-6 TaxID=2699468 RepID=UPI0008B235BB|nr:MMPL family transporter [Acidovorax sp. 210-6]MCL4768813.1 MMPL family transporter [Burkholderiaceae bacterium]NCU66865.1 RND family transporter [Acidovorax sp. 210-6]OGB45640.1 MAG: RND transporter [Burkholderiales bacterium RIFCSPLOWO2_12_FULL_65_40]HCE29575.1 RND transporter [Comamonadaceae bacterium]
MDLALFNPKTGSWVERLLFNHRPLVLLLCLLVTAVLAFQATHLRLNASFEKTIPSHHPYIVNYLANKLELTGLGDAVRIGVEAKEGSIYDPAYMETLRKINDEVLLLPGVDRPYMRSLWTPNVRWSAVTEDGLDGGPVIPQQYDESPQKADELRANVARSGEIGQLVSADGRASALFVPLLARTDAGELDYAALASDLERIRQTYDSPQIGIHITGYAKLVGDLVDGLREVLLYFVLSVAITTVAVFLYTHCIRSTLLVMVSSLVAVVWQLGLLSVLGQQLDPYSILVPFLVFAIGMSHGAQKMNGIMQDIGRGAHRLVAARLTFRRLFLTGLTALLADVVGFAVLLVIDIPVIRELAQAASLGVGVLIFTNLILLPILLSYTGVSARAAARSLKAEQASSIEQAGWLWRALGFFATRRGAITALSCGAVLAVVGWLGSQHLKIGDLDPGAPELRADSRYNRDVQFMTEKIGASSDLFAVMIKTPDTLCNTYDVLQRVDGLEWQLRQIPEVETTNSLALLNRQMMVGFSEGYPGWYDLPTSQDMLNNITSRAPRELYNDSCNLITLYVYLKDHKADTLDRVAKTVEDFAQRYNDETVTFQLAAGSAGIEAATNQVVRSAWWQMLALVYGVVAVLSFIAFRSWRAVVVAVLPLMLTSVLAEALMAWLGIGVKVATLPVIALGVGIGVDYALYILTVMLSCMRSGDSLAVAYHRALTFTGKVVILTGVTLAAGVATWAFSDIKFQGDMGILLAFMFLWNMLGALILLPALGYFILPRYRSDAT